MPEPGPVLLPLPADQGCQVTALIGRDDADGPRMSRRHGRDFTAQDVAGMPRAAADGERRRFARSQPGRSVRQPSAAGGADAELDRKMQASWSTSVLPCPMCCPPAEPSDNLSPRGVTMHRTFLWPAVTSRTVLASWRTERRIGVRLSKRPSRCRRLGRPLVGSTAAARLNISACRINGTNAISTPISGVTGRE